MVSHSEKIDNECDYIFRLVLAIPSDIEKDCGYKFRLVLDIL